MWTLHRQRGVSLAEIASSFHVSANMVPLEVTETHSALRCRLRRTWSGAAEIELDKETGEVKLLEFDAVCGLRHAHQPQS